MNIKDIFQLDNEVISQYVLYTAVALLVVAVILIINRRKINHIWLNVKTRYKLKWLGYKQISNFQCPDGLGHYFTIDRLILRHDGITLVVSKQYPGKIFCADNIDDWTQMLGLKSYRFKNPLDDLDYQIKAISALIPGVPVNGFLFFDHQATFPKGHPERVIYLDKIPDELKRSNNVKVETSVMSAWKQLTSIA